MARVKLRKAPDRSSMLGGSTIERLEKALSEKAPIWIQNNTIEPPLQISMPYMSAEGMTAIQLPRTSVPFNLAALVPHSALSSSTALRKLLASGSLLLLSEQEALEIIQIDADESNATFQSAFADANNTHAARAASQPDANDEDDPNDPIAREKRLARLTLAAIDPVAAQRLTASESKLRGGPQLARSRFDDVETRLARPGVSASTVLAELRRIADDLTHDDLTRITTNKDWCAEAQAWALKRLTAFAAQKKQKAETAAAVVVPGAAPAYAVGSALAPTSTPKSDD